MDRVHIIVNTWCPVGSEIEASEILKAFSSEEKALAWLEDWAHQTKGELKVNGHVLEVPLRGTDYNTYYIEDRDVE